MLKKPFLISVVLLISAAAVFPDGVFEEYEHAVGGFYGNVGGQGLSYQQWFGSFGIETAAGMSLNSSTGFLFNVGLQPQYRLYSDSFGDWLDGCLYLWAGGLFGSTGTATATSFYLNGGAGIGTEIVLFKHFSIPLEAGYFAGWQLGNIAPQIASFVVQGGLRYRF